MKWPKSSLLKAVLIGYTIVILIAGAIVLKRNFDIRWTAHLEDAGKVLISLSNEYESMTGNFGVIICLWWRLKATFGINWITIFPDKQI